MNSIRSAVSCAVLMGVASVTWAGPEDGYGKTTDGKKIAWMDKGMAAVKERLKDPASAQFRSVYFHRGSQNIPMTCGEVNSKNGFGGYSGFTKFVSAGSPDITFLASEVSDFDTVWQSYCR